MAPFVTLEWCGSRRLPEGVLAAGIEGAEALSQSSRFGHGIWVLTGRIADCYARSSVSISRTTVAASSSSMARCVA